MKWLVVKFGSNAMPSRPRSPADETVSETNGVERSAPFLTTRSFPACSEMNSRPSGANCMAVGLVTPLATRASEKPDGRVAAGATAGRRTPATHKQQNSRRRARRKKIMADGQEMFVPCFEQGRFEAARNRIRRNAQRPTR